MPNQQVTWIQTLNQTGIYLVQNSSTVSISNNGQQLTFVSLKPSDEEYYSCGYLSQNTFQIANNFFLYIRSWIISILYINAFFLSC